jgi:SAM-dependent methyltransferase
MSEKKFWDTIGNDYAEEIFSVFDSDKYGRLKKLVEKHAGRRKDAIDFGCGIGRALPLLAPNFRHVLAVDISTELLSIACQYPALNVTYQQADLAVRKTGLPPADFAFCANVAISDKPERNYRILENVVKGLKKNGTAVIVVPSVESAGLSKWTLMKLYKSEGKPAYRIPKSDKALLNGLDLKAIRDGIIPIDGNPTKHYQLTELFRLFDHGPTRVESLDKLEYPWTTELAEPPAGLKAPYPWDWVVEVRRVRQ